MTAEVSLTNDSYFHDLRILVTIAITVPMAIKMDPSHNRLIHGNTSEVYKRLGSEVTVVEYMDRIISTMDKGLSKELAKVLKKQKFKINTSHKVSSGKRVDDRVIVQAENKKGQTVTFEGDYCLVSVGRSAYTAGLNSDAAGVQLNERGQVVVNEHLQTTATNIYAIGDVVKGAMLAHKAEEEGVFVAEHIAGQKPHICIRSPRLRMVQPWERTPFQPRQPG